MKKENKKFNIIVVIIFSTGVILRVLKIINGGPLSFDEAWSFYVGSKGIGPLLKIVVSDKHPPLFYLLMHYWNMFYSSELWIRIPSLIASIANLFLFYALIKKVLNSNRLIFLGMFLFALSPSQINYGANARMYVLVTSFSLISIYSFYKLLELQSKKWFIVNAVTNFLFLSTHYMSIFSIITQFSYLILRYLRRNSEAKQKLVSWLLFQAPYIILGIFLLPFFLSQLTAGGDLAPRWIAIVEGKPALGELITQMALMELLPNLSRHFRIILGLAVCVIVLSSLFRYIRGKGLKFKVEEKTGFLLFFYVLPIISIWIISQFNPMFVGRYFIPYTFAWYILIANIFSKISLKIINWMFIPLLCFVVLFSAVRINFAHPYRESNWKEKSRIIAENWREGDVLLVLPIADLIRYRFYERDPNKKYYNLGLYKSIFRSSPKPVNREDMDQAFKDIPYKRIWFHEETDTGLSADFSVQQEGAVYRFLKERFIEADSPQYQDERGKLSLFVLK